MSLVEVGKNVIVRSRDVGVFAGKLIKLEGDTATVQDSRRLWYWSGAASLSELSQKGVIKPTECRFPIPVPEEIIFGVIEILTLTEEAKSSIDNVSVWTAQQ